MSWLEDCRNRFLAVFNCFEVLLWLFARWFVWLGGLVVSALGTRTRRTRFKSRVMPLFH